MGGVRREIEIIIFYTILCESWPVTGAHETPARRRSLGGPFVPQPQRQLLGSGWEQNLSSVSLSDGSWK